MRGAIEDLGEGQVEDDCGDAIVLIHRKLTSFRVLLRFPDGRTQQLYAAEPPSLVVSARCDPTGQHIAIVAGASYFGDGNDVYLADRAGNVRPLTSDHGTGTTAVFAADGRSLIVPRTVGDKQELFELFLDGRPMRRLTVDDGPDIPEGVSRDGRLLVFMRDVENLFPVLVTDKVVQHITTKQGMFLWPREVTPTLIVAQHAGFAGNEVQTLGVETGAITSLAHGTAVFPSIDGTTIYFAGAGDARTLWSIPVRGGQPTLVARLPNAIQFGNAGPDGLHVVVNTDGGNAEGYRIHDGAVEDEHTNGLVSVAPSGGWRAVTAYEDKLFGQGGELYLVPPGERIDQSTRHFPVQSITNRWLDDHRIGYCLGDHCEILDVTGGDPVKLPSADTGGMMATVMSDGQRVLDGTFEQHITRHVITNFDQR